MNESKFVVQAEAFIGACNCVSLVYSHDEGEFRPHHCDCCNSLPGTQFEVAGFNPTSNTIDELGFICTDCLRYFYNGGTPQSNYVPQQNYVS